MKRLVFLYYVHDHSIKNITKIIEREALTENSECLIEGTVKDRISHFTLRFLCASDYITQDFFIQSETKLFNYRLEFCDFPKLRHVLQKACKQSKFVLSNNCYILKSYEHILKSIILIAEEIEFAMEHRFNFIKVHFTSALKFVKERFYPLHSGYIHLPLNDLKTLLLYMFEETVIEGINQMKASLCMKELNDPRMLYMHQKVKKWLLSKYSSPIVISGKPFIKGSDIMTESLKFPLCMHNLHSKLLKYHRLNHISRIQYTLFLKEIGVPCSDVINLFMKEYSVPIESCKHSHAHCSHNWKDSEKRYIYSIEHLYGIRGARKNYKAHSCHSLQSNYDNEGGCPFVTFDQQHMRTTLENHCFEIKDIEDIISNAQAGKYQEACSNYLQCKVTKHHESFHYPSYYSDRHEDRKLFSVNKPKSDFLDYNLTLKEDYYKKVTFLKQSKFTSPCEFYSLLSLHV